MAEKRCAGCRKQSCNGCSLFEQIYSGKEGAALLPLGGFFSEGALTPRGFCPDEAQGLGIAFDIGTTTVAALLWDMEKREQIGAKTAVNPGRFAGSDVISRITYAQKSQEGREKLTGIMAQKLDEMAKDLCIGVSPEYTDCEIAGIQKVTVVGNTAMCELLLGTSLEGLTRAPFHKEYVGSVRKKGSELGFSFLKDTEVVVLPAIEGYVGADALAVHTWVKHVDGRARVLAVDVGTNGEILLFGEETDYACSAAAGPALEGAAVEQGMGAVDGAIKEVLLGGSFPREDIYCKVIGEGVPKGICGSGLVSALALLKKLKVIDETGYLRSRSEARATGVREQICRRIVEGSEENKFLLTSEDVSVCLTAGDIRQLQLAKGAIRAGIEVLFIKEGIAKEDIRHIYLAGSFGSNIQVKDAVEIGLLPEIETEKITHVGNCAGSGAVMALLSEKTIREMEEASQNIIHVELADEESFKRNFLAALDF